MPCVLPGQDARAESARTGDLTGARGERGWLATEQALLRSASSRDAEAPIGFTTSARTLSSEDSVRDNLAGARSWSLVLTCKFACSWSSPSGRPRPCSRSPSGAACRPMGSSERCLAHRMRGVRGLWWGWLRWLRSSRRSPAANHGALLCGLPLAAPFERIQGDSDARSGACQPSVAG